MSYKFYGILWLFYFFVRNLLPAPNHFSFRILFNDDFGNETLCRRMVGLQEHHEELVGSGNGLTEDLSRHLPGGLRTTTKIISQNSRCPG
jgi:hypothetical protein